VNPVNLYGATKLCQEKIFVQGNAYASQRDTRLVCVRYGNVVGSRGSVVPVFRQQMERDGRITITDERMTRFWIMLPQAVELVLYALEHMHGGEVFVPKIPSMRVTDLADAIAPGVPREIIGIRPGEKLHELLITADESRHTIDAGDVYVVLPEHPWWDAKRVRAIGQEMPDGFVYGSDTNDEWLTVSQLQSMLGKLVPVG
jgi:FlaA1/EpsC-like NDP-sugar epimerase